MKKIILAIFFLIVLLCKEYVFGEAWQDLTNGLTDGELYSIGEGQAASGEIIYVGTREGLYKKELGDTSWSQIFICRGQYKGINHICAGRGNAVYIATKNGLYESGDFGKSWKRLFRGRGEENNSTWITFDEEDKRIIYYLGTLKGLFWTEDNGDTWKKPAGILGKAEIKSIAVTKIQDGKYLFVICDNEIYKVAGDFKSYKKVFGFDSLGSSENNTDDVDDVIESERDIEDKPIFLLNHIIAKKDILYLSTSRGLFISADGGVSWSRFSNAGLPDSGISSVLVTDMNLPPQMERIFAATKDGVFEYNQKECLWNEAYTGMNSPDARKLMLSRKGELWVLCKKRIYNAKLANPPVLREEPRGANRVLREFEDEPDINETIAMAIEYAEVYPDKIKEWRNRAKFKALLPKVSFGIDQNRSNTYEIYTSSSSSYWLSGPEDKIDGWDLNFSWDLSDLIWSESQTSIDVRSKLMVQLRGDIVDEVTRTYFERRRLQVELLTDPPADLPALLKKQLRMQELTASLDGLTGSRFSRAITQDD